MLRIAAFIMVLTGLLGTMFAQNSADPLSEGFKTPPNSAKPRVWWQGMNGNITKEVSSSVWNE
jgi:hypothetical protein